MTLQDGRDMRCGMSQLYIDTFDDNGITKFALYFALYNDGNNPPTVYNEDWKPVVFETEDEAKAKLEELTNERIRENNAVPFSLEDAKLYAESHCWKFATTYAKTAPHEYLVKKWLVAEDQLLFERFIATIRAESVVGYFYGHKNDYLILGDHYYWFMPLPDNLAVDLINRTTTDYLEFRDGAYYYKPRK